MINYNTYNTMQTFQTLSFYPFCAHNKQKFYEFFFIVHNLGKDLDPLCLISYPEHCV